MIKNCKSENQYTEPFTLPDGRCTDMCPKFLDQVAYTDFNYNCISQTQCQNAKKIIQEFQGVHFTICQCDTQSPFITNTGCSNQCTFNLLQHNSFICTDTCQPNQLMVETNVKIGVNQQNLFKCEQIKQCYDYQNYNLETEGINNRKCVQQCLTKIQQNSVCLQCYQVNQQLLNEDGKECVDKCSSFVSENSRHCVQHCDSNLILSKEEKRCVQKCPGKLKQKYDNSLKIYVCAEDDTSMILIISLCSIFGIFFSVTIVIIITIIQKRSIQKRKLLLTIESENLISSEI